MFFFMNLRVWQKANLRDVPPGCSILAGEKISNDIFQAGQIQHLHVKFLNECQMVLLSG
jgi:hypothetical protein